MEREHDWFELGAYVCVGLVFLLCLSRCEDECEAKHCPPGFEATMMHQEGCMCIVRPK